MANPNPFLQEVLLNPDDDVPRLVYADWLEEQGDPRGEFIRVQCELAASDESNPAHTNLIWKSQAMLEEHGEQWAKELQQDARKVFFQRGFVDTITLRAKVFLEEGEALFDSVPVHWLRFNFFRGNAEKLADCPTLERVRALDFSGMKIAHEDYTTFFASPHLTNLRSLNVTVQGGNPLSGVVGRAIATSAAAKTLENLELRQDSYEVEDHYESGFLDRLAGGDGFPQLRRLTLGIRHYKFDTTGIEQLRVPKLKSLLLSGEITPEMANRIFFIAMPELELLDLGRTALPAESLLALGVSGLLPQLKKFTLGSGHQEETLRLLASDQLANCEELNLNGYEYSRNEWETNWHPFYKDQQSMVRQIAENDAFGNLKTLRAHGVLQEDVMKLAKAKQLSGLQNLMLMQSGWTAQALSKVCQSPWTESLRVLRMSGNISEKSIELLAQTEFPNLHTLYISRNTPTCDLDEAFAELFRAGNMPNLHSLEMPYAGAGQETLTAISRQPKLANLHHIDYRQNSANIATVQKLLRSEVLPNLNSIRCRLRSNQKLNDEFGARMM